MNQSRVILAALVGLLVLATATHTLADANDDELQFQSKPAAADSAEPSSPSNNGLNPIDNTINGQQNENGNGLGFGQQQQQQQQLSPWSPPRPSPGQGRRPGLPSLPNLFDDGFSLPNIGDPFGQMMPHQRPPFGGSLFGRLLAPFDDMGQSMFDSMHRMRRRMNNVFDQVRSKAGTGEEVSYFIRNNEAFKKTCKIEQVDMNEMNQQSIPNEQNQQSIPDIREIDQQLQPQLEQPQQQQQRAQTTEKPL